MQKRDKGLIRIFIFSAAVVMLLLTGVWLVTNRFIIGLAEVDRGRYQDFYRGAVPDMFTPWFFMAAAIPMFYRFSGICAADSVSIRKTVCSFAAFSAVAAAVFSALDVICVKFIMQEKTELALFTNYEMASGNCGAEISRGAGNCLLIFAVLTVMYTSFALTGGYIMQCLSERRYGLLAYYAAGFLCTVLYEVLVVPRDHRNYIIEIPLRIFTLTNPFLFCFEESKFAELNAAVFIILNLIFIAALIIFEQSIYRTKGAERNEEQT